MESRHLNLLCLVALALCLLQQWHLSRRIDAVLITLQETCREPAEIRQTTNANGNVISIDAGLGKLPDSPRTVEQVANFLGVTPDTVRESYIREWIAAGLMSPEDRVANRWMIPPTFTPYRPK